MLFSGMNFYHVPRFKSLATDMAYEIILFIDIGGF